MSPAKPEIVKSRNSAVRRREGDASGAGDADKACLCSLGAGTASERRSPVRILRERRSARWARARIGVRSCTAPARPRRLKPRAACENRARAVSVRLPHLRLGGIYFAYFVFIGAFSPYFSLYLQSIGQAAWQIGLLLSLMQLMRIVAPNLWASLADRHGWRARLLQGTLAVAIATYCGVFITTDFAGLFVVLAAFAFFSSATMPLVEAITLARLREPHRGLRRDPAVGVGGLHRRGARASAGCSTGSRSRICCGCSSRRSPRRSRSPRRCATRRVRTAPRASASCRTRCAPKWWRCSGRTC